MDDHDLQVREWNFFFETCLILAFLQIWIIFCLCLDTQPCPKHTIFGMFFFRYRWFSCDPVLIFWFFLHPWNHHGVIEKLSVGIFYWSRMRGLTVIGFGRPPDSPVSGSMHKWSKMYSLGTYQGVNLIYCWYTTIVGWNFNQRSPFWGVDFWDYVTIPHHWHDKLSLTQQWDVLLVATVVFLPMEYGWLIGMFSSVRVSMGDAHELF